MRQHILAITFAAVAIAACTSEEPNSPQSPETIQLTAAQASAIRARVGQIAPIHPELAFLADTISLIVGPGLEVSQVEVNEGCRNECTLNQYYAVSLQRTIRAGEANSAAFDVILFNDASNPTDFIIVNGWTNPNTNTDSPSSLTGTIGVATATSVVHAHMFRIAGSEVQSWRGITGTASFSRGATSGTCPALPDSQGVTCQSAELEAEFNFEAMSDDPVLSATRAAGLSTTSIDGIIIRMTIQ